MKRLHHTTEDFLDEFVTTILFFVLVLIATITLLNVFSVDVIVGCYVTFWVFGIVAAVLLRNS